MEDLESSSCIVADDEPLVRTRIARLAEQNGLTVSGTAANGHEALHLIRDAAPAIAFLDIRMPGMDGLQLVEALSDLPSPPVVVFVTAHAEHALTAFALSAIDYVVKPVEAGRFAAAVERAQAAVLGNQARETLGRLRGVLKFGRAEQLTFRSGARLVSVPPGDVIRFSACDDYVEAHLAGTSHLLNVTMEALEKSLCAPFIRTHRSHIANIDRVGSASPAGDGRLELVMIDGARVPVSRGRSEKVKSLLVAGGADAQFSSAPHRLSD